MNKIETFIKDENSNNENESSFLPITNLNSVKLVNNILHENEGDYLEGAISLIFDSEIILSENMETTDLLFTWQTVVEPILVPNKKNHEIVLLDSLYEVKLLLVDDGYIFHRRRLHENCEVMSKVIPKKEYIKLVKEGFLKFGEYILDNQFSFSEESSFPSFVDDYKKIRQNQNEEIN